MRPDYFNSATYTVTDNITGEVVDVAIFIEQASRSGWQKAYAKVLAEYIRCGGGKSEQLLAYIIEKKDGNTNILHGTQIEIAKMSGVSRPTVARVFETLIEKGMLKKIRSGAYLVTPKMLVNGNKKVGAMVLRLWGEL